MEHIRNYPVAVLSTIVVMYNAALAVAQSQHLLAGHTLGWALVIEAAVTSAVGMWVHGSVTPLNRPRNSDGTDLVPFDQTFK